MNPFLGRSLLAGAVVLSLAFPGWAAEEAKTAQVKEEKMETKAVSPGSDEVDCLSSGGLELYSSSLPAGDFEPLHRKKEIK